MAKGNIIIGLDIGTGTIKAVAALKPKAKKSSFFDTQQSRQEKEENLEVLATSEEISSGVRKGVVVNHNEVASLVQAVFKKIKEQIDKKVNSAFINVGGSHIFSTSSRGLVSVSRADQKVSPEDVERVLQAAQTLSLPSNKEILEVLPREFIIDGERGIKEVLGMQGVRLEAEVLILGGFTPYLKNLTSAVLNSGLQIDDLVLSPLASSRAVLTPREKELGAALLDIGAGTTDMAVFQEGSLIHLAILPIGSGHITNDIAIGLKTDIDVAERIKLEFGNLFFQGGDKKEKIKLGDESKDSSSPFAKARVGDESKDSSSPFAKARVAEGETLIFSPKQLSKIIEARVSEIFREANKELKKISKQQLLPAGIVLTGGGARLPKIRELAKKEFRLPCRLGFPQGFSPSQDDPRFSVACGLVLRGADLEENWQTLNWHPSFKKRIGRGIKRMFKVFLP
jgi:cell division protein FtsA